MDRYGRGTELWKFGAVIGIVVIAAIVTATLIVPWVEREYLGVAPPVEEGPEEGEEEGPELFAITAPIKLNIFDALGDNTIAGGNVLVYTLDGRLYENIDNFSNGVATSSFDYNSGDIYDIEIMAGGCVNEWHTDYTIPKAHSRDASYISDDMEVKLEPTFAVKVQKPDGTYITDTDNAAVDNLSKGDASKPTLTFEVRNTLDDSGWNTSYDPRLDRHYRCVFWMRLESNQFEDIVVTAGNLQYKGFTSKRVWFVDIPDFELNRDLSPDLEVINDGVYQVNVTLDLTGWTDTSNAIDCVYGVDTYTSAAYYDYYGTWGTLASETSAQFKIVA